MLPSRLDHALAIVDDDPLVRRLVRMCFQHRTAVAVVAELEARGDKVGVLRAAAPDIVVVDVDTLDPADGWAQLDALLAATPHAMIVTFSAWNRPGDVARARQAGAFVHHPEARVTELPDRVAEDWTAFERATGVVDSGFGTTHPGAATGDHPFDVDGDVDHDHDPVRSAASPELRALRDLAGLLLEGTTFEAYVRALLDVVVREVASVHAASVTVEERRGRFLTVASTSDDVDAVDLAQYEQQDGPCIEALRTGVAQAVEVPAGGAAGIATDPAVEHQVTAHGYTSVVALPLRVGDGEVIGALNLFAVERIDADDRARAEQLALPVAVAVANGTAYRRVVRLADQLQVAFSSRATIEQAKGLLAAEQRVDVEVAFERLVTRSQQENRKLRDVAAAVVERHRTTVTDSDASERS